MDGFTISNTLNPKQVGLAKQSLNDDLSIDLDRWLSDPERIAHFVNGQSSYEFSVLAPRETRHEKAGCTKNIQKEKQEKEET